MARTAQLLDAQRRVIARVAADSDQFMAELLPEDYERVRSCRLLDAAGKVLGEAPITRKETPHEQT